MTRKVHIPVTGRLNQAGGLCEGTITIDRSAGLIWVRPKHCRKTYTLPLDKVADMIVLRVVRAELFEKRLQKAAKKKLMRRGR